MPSLAAWLHTLDPFALRLTHDMGVRWYGLAYIGGFVAAWLILRALAKRRLILLTVDQVTDALFAVVLGTLLGGRLGYILIYDPALLWSFSNAPPWWGALAINRGGMASHGGMAGVAVACWWTARRSGTPLLHVMDCFALVAPVGILFGRLANFVNGELLGRIVAMPGESAPKWSVKFPQELLEGHAPTLTPEQQLALDELLTRVASPGDTRYDATRNLIDDIQNGATDLARELEPLLAARHPSQLYQAAAEGILLGAALWLLWSRPRRAGFIAAWFLLLYGVGRITTEYWRLPDAHLPVPRPGGLSYGQWLSVGMVVIGGAMLWRTLRDRAAPRIGGWATGRRSISP
jgi:phosphatidylglycerol:prolipoprotein diacylglycerol transferase